MKNNIKKIITILIIILASLCIVFVIFDNELTRGRELDIINIAVMIGCAMFIANK